MSDLATDPIGTPHETATCAWCPSPLVVAEVERTRAWVCPTDWARQTAHAIFSVRKGVRTCHYVPLPSQCLLYETPARYVLWGGQAGPGKSHGVRWWLYDRSLQTPGHEALLLRENWDQLDVTHLRKMEHEVPQLGGRFFKSDRKVVFGKGSDESIIDAGHMAEEGAVTRYLSTEYGAIVADEASLYPVAPDGTTPLAELSTRARKVYTDRSGNRVPPRFIPVTNPGGPSGDWLRSMFIRHEPDLGLYPQLRTKYHPDEWVYLPARLDDNPYMDPAYADSLAVLRGWRYQQMRLGDWDVFPGQFFEEWDPSVHVKDQMVDPRRIDHFVSMDWGHAAPGCFLWWACLPDGRYHITHEWKFHRLADQDIAAGFHQRNKTYGIEKVRYVVVDPSLGNKDGRGDSRHGQSRAETLRRLGLNIRLGDNDRPAGWARIRALLRGHRGEPPHLTVAPDCTYLIRSLPAQKSDPHDLEDIDTGGDDHAADTLRYGAMSRPAPTTHYAPTVKLHPLLEEALAASRAGVTLGSESMRRHT
ncbi:MAG TPA: hypothetical protein VK467_04080 [Gemmatimonadales bacterium]|nr:hypothetical protein [Gemmatimonadales bacterium]